MSPPFTFFIHTHTDCLDALAICVGQLHKYFPEHRKVVGINREPPEPIRGCETFLYDESVPYTERLLKLLPEVKDEVILYMHEDMLLYDNPDHEELERMALMVKGGHADFLKLIAVKPLGNVVTPNVRTIEGDYYFSVQPTLWRTSSLENLLDGTSLNIWDLESTIQKKARRLTTGFCYYKGVEQLRGLMHYDSHIFPYVATAIVKGRWNTAEYPFELKDLFREYKTPMTRDRNGM